jgi:hypothetical protein
MPVTFPFLLVGPRFFLERRRHPQACEELNIHEEIEAGCFLTGHPQIKEPLSGAALGFADDRVYLFGVGGAPLGSVSYESVHWVSVEAHADVLKRFSEARLMLLGHKQLSFRARQTTEAWYVVVEWKGPQGSPHDGIFCFEGLAADSRARAVADAILHYADCHRHVSGRSGHERFNQSLDAFEARRCEHCGKMHRPSGSS